MYAGLIFSAWLIFVPFAPINEHTAQRIPSEVRSMLDNMHSGWRLAAVCDEVRSAIGERLGETPNLIAGDFDGNNCLDIALLCEYPNIDDPHSGCTHFVELIAFLASEKGYMAIQLRRRYLGPNPWLFLTLHKRGDQCIDFFAEKRFTLVNDSIGEACYGKVSGVYIYEEGKFRYVGESD